MSVWFARPDDITRIKADHRVVRRRDQGTGIKDQGSGIRDQGARDQGLGQALEVRDPGVGAHRIDGLMKFPQPPDALGVFLNSEFLILNYKPHDIPGGVNRPSIAVQPPSANKTVPVT